MSNVIRKSKTNYYNYSTTNDVILDDGVKLVISALHTQTFPMSCGKMIDVEYVFFPNVTEQQATLT